MSFSILNFFFIKLNIWSLYNIFTLNLNFFLIIANFIFLFGLFGIILNQRNFLLSMLFIEVMYTGIFFYFIITSIYTNTPIGQVYALSILVSAACESAIGLGILLILFKYDNTVNFNDFTELKG